MPGRNQPALPNRVQLQISHIGKKHGPVPISAVVTEMPKFDGPKMVTVRFLAPAFYRRHVAGVTKDDDPTTVIFAVAANVGCRASLLTGGKWEVANHPHGPFLIGNIKVNESAEKLLKNSGRQALFVAILENRCCLGASSKTNFWRLLQTILTRAQVHGSPLVLRRGGGSDLGVIGMSQTAVSAGLIRTWELHGSPKHWTTDEVSDFLTKNTWTQIDVLNKIRRNSQCVWIFKAKAAPAQQQHENDLWHYTDQNSAWHLTIAPIQSRMRKPVPTEQVAAPRKGWWQKASCAGCCYTNRSHCWNPGPFCRRGTCPFPTSPRGKRWTCKTQEDFWIETKCSLLKTLIGLSSIMVDPVIALSVVLLTASPNSSKRTWALKPWSGKAADCGCWPLDISLHIRHHKAIFEPFSAPDSAEANLFRANQEAPAEYADYVLAASHRDYYADDLLLNALAERLLTPIVVFAWSTTRQIWERSVVCSQFQMEQPSPV